jgi:flagellar biosynthesis chaperone FliJ
MAREINAELLDTKIEKAQQDLVKAKHRYDAAAATLKDMLDKRDALRQKKLLDAIA